MDGTNVRHWDSWIPGHPDFGVQRPWSPNPDNVKNFFETGIKNTTSLSFAKGGEDYSFRATARASQNAAVVPNAQRDVYDLNISGEIDLTDNVSIYSSLNARLQQTDNYASSGYGSLASNFSQWWQRQLDMDRLEKNYYYKVLSTHGTEDQLETLDLNIGMLLTSSNIGTRMQTRIVLILVISVSILT